MFRYLFLSYTFSCFLLLISNILSAQYYFNKLTEENGLSDNRVTCFLKDKTGFLWVGTKNGLNRYDGNTFKIFKPTAGNSISNEVINDIVQDSSGKIWVATISGLNMYDPLTNRWETIMPAGSDQKNDLPSYILWDLEVDENNCIWIVSDVWDLSMYDPVTKKFTYYDWPAAKQQQQFSAASRYRSIKKIVRKNNHEWWLGTTIGLFSVAIQSGEFTFYGAGYNGDIRDIQYNLPGEDVFVTAENGRLFNYYERQKQYKEIVPVNQSYPPVQWKWEKSSCMLMAHPKGMLEVNTVNRKANLIMPRPALSSSLFTGGTNCIYTDNAGIVWVATNLGVNYYNSHNNAAEFIPLSSAAGKEIEDGMSAAIYDVTDSSYFITSLHSREVFIIHANAGGIRSIQSAGGKRFSACTNICTDNENNIWLLTATNVYRYNRKKKQFHLFATPNNNHEVIFHDMVQDKNGDYWLGTWTDGLYKFKTKEKLFYKFSEQDGFYSKSFSALLNDPFEEAVWLGTYQYGINRFDLKKDTFTEYAESKANPDYIQLNLIRDTEKDVAGKIWVATHGAGLYVYTHGKSYATSFNHITLKKGLTSSSYFSITADNKNRLWLLSSKGISAISDQGEFLYETVPHPVINFSNYTPEARYPKRIFYNTIKNELLVPVAGGLLLYYPDQKIPPVNFSIVLTGISVAGQPMMYDSLYLQKQQVEIPFRSNSLWFQFAALKYAGISNIMYEYKLHQDDEAWVLLPNSNTINFPSLSAGKYTFMIRAKDGEGNISANTASFSFQIQPPYWQTGWFYIMVAAAIGLLFYAIYRYQLNKKLEVERLRLRISRDLHDDIGSALSSISILSKVALNKGEKDAALTAYLSKINESSAQSMESMSDIVWAINPTNDTLESIMSRMKEFAADLCEAKGIELDFILPQELEKLSFNLYKRKNLFLVFKEAVNNAAKYSGCKQLKVAFERPGNKIKMTVTDDGNGFDKGTITGGNGLRNMKERARECGGNLQVDTIIKKGTKIILEMPVTRFGG